MTTVLQVKFSHRRVLTLIKLLRWHASTFTDPKFEPENYFSFVLLNTKQSTYCFAWITSPTTEVYGQDNLS